VSGSGLLDNDGNFEAPTIKRFVDDSLDIRGGRVNRQRKVLLAISDFFGEMGNELIGEGVAGPRDIREVQDHLILSGGGLRQLFTELAP
jgi:hypothetical protein